MSINQNHISPRHWPLLLSSQDAALYVGYSDVKTFRKFASLAGLDPIPYVNRWARDDLDKLPFLLRQKHAEEQKIVLSAIKNEERQKIS